MEHRGLTKVLKHASGISWNSDYEATGSAKWWVFPYSSAEAQAPAIGEAHPKHAVLGVDSVTISEGDGGAYIEAQYKGRAPGAPELPAFTVSAQPVVREAPITTHPDFSEWAGTQANPKEAVFDLSGRFVSWLPSSDLSGQEAWLMPSLSVTVSTVEPNEPSLSGFLSKRFDSAQGLPDPGDRDYLGVGIPYSGPDVDGNYAVDREYLLSGPEGWNERVYP